MVPSPRAPKHFATHTGDGPAPALSVGPPAQSATPTIGSASAAPTSALLAALSFQHERLQQMVTDIAVALAEAHATVGQASGALQGMKATGACGAGGPVDEAEPSADGSCVEIERTEASAPASEGPRSEEVAAQQSRASRHCTSNRTSRLASVAAGEHLSAEELLEMTDRGLRRGSSQEGVREGRRSRQEGGLPSLEGRPPSQEDGFASLEGRSSSQEAQRISRDGRNSSDESACGPAPSGKAGSAEDDVLAQIDVGRGPSTEDWRQVRRNALFRLKARLGKKNLKGMITPLEIHRAVRGLGLDKYTLTDIRNWLVELGGEINMLESEGSRVRRGSSFKKRASALLGWHWPRAGGIIPSGMMMSTDSDDYVEAAVPLAGFARLLLDDNSLSTFRAETQEMSLTIREVLFSGDANRLVAELTNVRVDEVAAPREKVDCLSYLEPVVAFMIILNGIAIGLQSGSDDSGLNEWFWCNAAFTAFFLAEILIRGAVVGPMQMVTGADRWWNAFDVLMSAVALFDLIFEAIATSGDVAPLFVLRLLRLTRITRLVRIFRLRKMKELTLMLRGLLGGLHTLFWAVMLLFFTIYMIACLATATIGRGELVPQVEQDRLFVTVWNSFFTCFRCFMGDCTTSAGTPIAKLLSDRYGAPFTLAYFASMIFVVFGIFNLIVAIYIENTLEAAKAQGEQNKVQSQRESVRIARLTRQLLKKFCAIESRWGESQNGDAKEVKRIMTVANFADVSGISATVSKDMFLCLIQDASVQKLMDELDIPSERAALFDILDADGSGGLEVIELITGLLRVRGEAKRSDVVATLLAVRVVQDMIRECTDRVASLESIVERTAEASSNTLKEKQLRTRSTFERRLSACVGPIDGVLPAAPPPERQQQGLKGLRDITDI